MAKPLKSRLKRRHEKKREQRKRLSLVRVLAMTIKIVNLTRLFLRNPVLETNTGTTLKLFWTRKKKPRCVLKRKTPGLI